MFSEQEFKYETNIYHNKKLDGLSAYVSKKYDNDMFSRYYIDLLELCVETIMKIKKHYDEYKQNVIVIDLDETFLQNDHYYKYTYKIWDYNIELYEKYEKMGSEGKSVLMPFMYILYRYCVKKNIKIVLLSGRDKDTYYERTKEELSIFDIYEYDLYLCNIKDTRKYKNEVVEYLNDMFNIVGILNDQQEITGYYDRQIYYPKLYIIYDEVNSHNCVHNSDIDNIRI